MIHETHVPELHPFIEVSSDIDRKMDRERPGQKRQNLTGRGHLIGDIEGLGQSKINAATTGIIHPVHACILKTKRSIA